MVLNYENKNECFKVPKKLGVIQLEGVVQLKEYGNFFILFACFNKSDENLISI